MFKEAKSMDMLLDKCIFQICFLNFSNIMFYVVEAITMFTYNI